MCPIISYQNIATLTPVYNIGNCDMNINQYSMISFLTKMVHSLLKKKLVSTWTAPQKNGQQIQICNSSTRNLAIP